jgi:hypothetical protein
MDNKRILINEYCEKILYKLYTTKWKYPGLGIHLAEFIGEGWNRCGLTHEENIDILDILIQELSSHGKNNQLEVNMKHLQDIYESMINDTLTYDNFLAYRKVVYRVKFYGRFKPLIIYPHHWNFLLIPTQYMNYNLVDKNIFHKYVLVFYDDIISNRYSNNPRNTIIPIQIEMIRKGMEYFNYPQELINWVTDPASKESLIFGYINGELYYDFSLVTQHARMISNREKIYTFNKIRYISTAFVGKKYNDYVQMYYKYSIRKNENSNDVIEYVFIKNIPIRGFLKCGFRIYGKRTINISFDNYIIKNMELQWRDLVAEGGDGKEWRNINFEKNKNCDFKI